MPILYLATPIAVEWATALEAVIADPAFIAAFDFFADRRGAADVPTSAFVDGAAHYLESRPEILSGRRWAVVTGSPAGFGMAPKGQMGSERSGLEVEVFKGTEEALAWLRPRWR